MYMIALARQRAWESDFSDILLLNFHYLVKHFVLGIKMTPKDIGIFNKGEIVKFNSINNKAIEVKIKGNV